MDKNMIYELRVICRRGEREYPFEIYTDAKYYYLEFAKAEAAVQRMVKEYAQKEWKEVYRYGIYTYSCNTEISDANRDAIDVVIYLPDGTQWIDKGAKGVLCSGEVYERIVANSVHIGILQDENPDDTKRYRFLECGGEYNKDLRDITEIMPCSQPVPVSYTNNMQSKLERYEAVQHEALTPTFGLPYDAVTVYDEDMDDYLYIPAAFSGLQYDLFFDYNTAYQKNMHPMWFYVAYPDNDKIALIPITVSDNTEIMCDKYKYMNCELDAELCDFILFNFRDIMRLADRCYKPDDFLWNMTRLETILASISADLSAIEKMNL